MTLILNFSDSLDKNVHNVAVDGSFDDCQDFVKELFGDADIRSTHQLAAVNSINWARILAQMYVPFLLQTFREPPSDSKGPFCSPPCTALDRSIPITTDKVVLAAKLGTDRHIYRSYYAFSVGRLLRDRKIDASSKVRFSVPTGNFGDVLAGYFAQRMGFPIDKLVVATNENDILDRFWKTGYYEKRPLHGYQENGGFVEDGVKAHEDGVRDTPSPAMNILVSSNFERLLWYLSFQVYGSGLDTVEEKRAEAGRRVKGWLQELKSQGGFGVEPKLLEAAKISFESERVSNKQTIAMIKRQYSAQTPAAKEDASSGTAGAASHGKYILDPHSAVGVEAALRSIQRAPPPETTHIALATAHPAKFSKAVEEALADENDFRFQDLLPEQFVGLEELEKRRHVFRKSEGIEGLRKFIRTQVPSR